MATITDINRGTTGTTDPTAPAPPAPAAPRKRGRPRNTPRPPEPPDDDDEATVEDAAPDSGKSNKDIWLEFANYTADEWDKTIAYLYRVAPTIDRRSGGRPINIRKYAGPFDKDRVMLDEGSGVYRIDILKINDQGKYQRIAKEYFDILNMDYPPRVPPGDWIEDPANEVWKWAKPQLEAKSAAANGGAMYPPGFDLQKMTDQIYERAERMATANNPSNALIEKLVEKALTPAPAPVVDNTATNQLFQLMKDQLSDSRAEIAAMREKLYNQPPQKNLIEQFMEIRPQLKELVAMFAEKNSKQNVWESLLEKVVESVPDVISLVKEGREASAAPAGIAGIAAPAPAAAPAAATAATGTPEEQQARQQLDIVLKKWQAHLLEIAQPLVESFKTSNGYYFRDWYREMHGSLKWADLKRDIPPELLANMYHSHPKLKFELAPIESLVLFLTEFECVPGEEPPGVVQPDPAPDSSLPN